MALDKTFYIGNRQKLISALPDSLIVLTAGGLMQRRADAAYPFEQEANFWYLTGIEEPDWKLIIDAAGDKQWLVAPSLDEIRTVFEGSVDIQTAKTISGIETVISEAEADELLATFSGNKKQAYTVLPTDHAENYGFYLNPAHGETFKMLAGKFSKVSDCRKAIEKLRAIKQPEELEVLQQAVDITVDGITSMLTNLHNFSYEYEIEAELNRSFRLAGGQGHAYDPIIAAGKNACTLHYQKNSSKLNPDEWLLFDVGARFGSYCADITRTLPLGDKPSQKQIDIYEAVRKVHDLALELCRPGQSVAEYDDKVTVAMGVELKSLGLINDPTDRKQIHDYFPHAISHGLGIDVHDPLGRPSEFEPGMVLTIEPGIYFKEEGFGVRLENDIHIAADGPKNLSRKLPSSLDELRGLAA